MEPYNDFGDFSYQDAEPSPASQDSVFTDFFGAAQQKLSQVLAPITADRTSQGPSVGSQLFDAIYQYGAGRVDQAREKAVGAFLMTSEGKKVQRSGIQQTLTQYAPYIILAVLGFIFLGASLGRR